MVNNWLLVDHKNSGHRVAATAWTRIYTIKPMKSKESAERRKNQGPQKMLSAALLAI